MDRGVFVTDFFDLLSEPWLFVTVFFFARAAASASVHTP
jgi:hypothetical protein